MEKALNNFFYRSPKSPAYVDAYNLLKTVGKKHDRKKIIKWLESRMLILYLNLYVVISPIGLMTFGILLMRGKEISLISDH